MWPLSVRLEDEGLPAATSGYVCSAGAWVDDEAHRLLLLKERCVCASAEICQAIPVSGTIGANWQTVPGSTA